MECAVAPITRIPVGVQKESCLPSTLDYAASSRGVLREGSIFWKGVPADHAGVAYESDRISWESQNQAAPKIFAVFQTLFVVIYLFKHLFMLLYKLIGFSDV